MKTQPKHLAFANFRLLVAFSLCLGAAFLTASALTSFGGSKTESKIKTVTAKKNGKNGRSSMATKETERPGVSKDAGKTKALDQSNLDTSYVPKVTEQRNADGQTVYSIAASKFDISQPLIEMAKTKVPLASEEVEHEDGELPSWLVLKSGKKDPVTQVAPSAETDRGPVLSPPTIGFNFAGVIGTGSFPPDNNGSVGNDQYVETVNTRYQVWSLNRTNNTATSLVGPVEHQHPLGGFGGACQTQNSGDPVVLFDKAANRWLISQFTSAAVSGVLLSVRRNLHDARCRWHLLPLRFRGPERIFRRLSSLRRLDGRLLRHGARRLPAAPAAMPAHTSAPWTGRKCWRAIPPRPGRLSMIPTEGGHMPADLDGFAPPPGGAPGVFLSLHGSGMYIYRMKVDFANAANTTRPLQGIVQVAPATAACGGGNCIPQPGSTVVLPALSDRLMFRAAYRNYIDHESIVISHSVDPSITGVRLRGPLVRIPPLRPARRYLLRPIPAFISRAQWPMRQTGVPAGCRPSRWIARRTRSSATALRV